jgi:hypothetical protein
MAKGFKSGGGSRKGVPNKTSQEFRETVRALLDANSGNVQRWLTLVAEGDGTDTLPPDPARALDLMAKLAEYAAPKLGRIEHTGAEGKALPAGPTIVINR